MKEELWLSVSAEHHQNLPLEETETAAQERLQNHESGATLNAGKVR